MDPIVGVVGDVDVALPVDCDTLGLVELGGRCLAAVAGVADGARAGDRRRVCCAPRVLAALSWPAIGACSVRSRWGRVRFCVDLRDSYCSIEQFQESLLVRDAAFDNLDLE